MIGNRVVNEARAEVTYHIEIMQSLLWGPERGPDWLAQYQAAYQRWRAARERWVWLKERMN